MGVAPGVFLKPMEPSVLRTIDRINQVRLASAAPAVAGRPITPGLPASAKGDGRGAEAFREGGKVGPTGGGGR